MTVSTCFASPLSALLLRTSLSVASYVLYCWRMECPGFHHCVYFAVPFNHDETTYLNLVFILLLSGQVLWNLRMSDVE